MPTLASIEGGPITTVAPSTTATALTSIITGLTPGEHGLIGYRMDVGGEILNVLRWATDAGDARRKHHPRRVQPFAPFLGEPVPVVSKADLEGSAFTEAHLRGGRMDGWRAPPAGRHRRATAAAGERFVYAYYDGIDKIAHERGFGPYYDAELRSADDIVGRCCPADRRRGAAGDGGPRAGAGREQRRAPRRPSARAAAELSGEGPVPLAACRPGVGDELLAAATAAHGDVAWVMSREEMVDGVGSARSSAHPSPLGSATLRWSPGRPISSSTPPTAGPMRWCVDTDRSQLLRCWCRCWPPQA